MSSPFKSIFLVIALLQLWLQIGFADISIIEPKPYKTFESGKGDIKIYMEWKDSFSPPSVSSIKNYTIALCNGTNTKIKQVKILEKGAKVEKNGELYKVNVKVDPSKIDDGVYYLQIIGKGKEFHTIHYTHRFQIDSSKKEPSEDLTIQPPAAEVAFEYQQQDAVSKINSHSFTVPYLHQTGDVKYAPFQPRPEKTKKAGRWKPSSTTKSISSIIFKSKAGKHSIPTPNVKYTVTQPSPKTYPTKPNTIPGVSTKPSGYNPSSRLSKPSLKNTRSSIKSKST